MVKTILVVDDSATDRRAIVDIVRSLGYRAIEAQNAEEAYALALSEKPGLILMDVVMPGASGYEATRKIAKDPAFEATPVIIVSNRSKETDKLWGLRQGAVAYLFKPVEPKALAVAIQKVLPV